MQSIDPKTGAMTARVICLCIFLSVTQFSFAQEYVDQRETFFDAEYYFGYEDYREAVFHYVKLHNFQKYNASLNYKIGVCYLNIIGSKTKAIPYLENAIRNTGKRYRPKSYRAKKAPYEAFLLLGRAYRINNQLDKAEATLKEYEALLGAGDLIRRELLNRELEIVARARELQKTPIDVRITNLGENFNTGNNDFNPAISGDGNSMVFMTSLRFYDAIMYTTNKDGVWSPPVPVIEQLGSDGDHYVSSLSWDGTEMYVVVGDQYESNIHVSYLRNGIWSRLQKLNRQINTSGREAHASLSKDGLSLYFTSNRAGGFGGLDIYRSVRQPGGDWEPAENLGSVINTSFDEKAPFLTEDGEKLYFSSFGHDNMGEFDIFYSRVGADGRLSVPRNIGWSLNTTDDDLFFVPVNNGTAGYMSAFSEDSFGGSDLYFVEFDPTDADRVIPVLNFKDFSNIRDKYHTRLVDTLDTGMVLLSVIDDNHKRSDYFIPYEFLATEGEITLKESLPVLDRCVTINSVFFDFNRYDINRYASYELEKAIYLLKLYPDIELAITGHTCSVGSDAVNQSLSEKRAKAVYDYMVKRGIEPTRLSIKGEGKRNPVAINKNPDGSDNPIGRSYNQRAEIRVTTTGYEFIQSEDVFVPEHLRIKK
jgi:hypothetical protein